MSTPDLDARLIAIEERKLAVAEAQLEATRRGNELLAKQISPPQGDQGALRAQVEAWASEDRHPRTWRGRGFLTIPGPDPRTGEKYFVAFQNFRTPVEVRAQERFSGRLAGKVQYVAADPTDVGLGAFDSLARGYITAHQFGNAPDRLRGSYGGEADAAKIELEIGKATRHAVWSHLRKQAINMIVGKASDEVAGLEIEAWEIEAEAPPPPPPARVAEPPQASAVEPAASAGGPLDPRRLVLGYHEGSPRVPGRAAKRGGEITGATIAGPDPGGRSPAPRDVGKRDSPPRADES